MRDLVKELEVPEFTAGYVLSMIDARNTGGFVIPDERAMAAAERRGLVEEVQGGWKETHLARQWAQQYRRRHLRLLPLVHPPNE
jgi:hypothetical protein